MAAKDASDRRRTHPDAELAQLALDAYTTPAAVLSPQAHDQLHQLRAHRWPPRASLPPPRSPLPSPGFSVPTEQCRRRDQESLPALTRKEPAEGGQQGAVRSSVPDAAMELSLKDAHLVPEHDQLDVLVSFAAPGYGHDRTGPGTGRGRGARRPQLIMMTGDGANCQLKAPIEVLAPFTTFRRPSSSYGCSRSAKGEP